MLATPRKDRENQRFALITAGFVAAAAAVASVFSPAVCFLLAGCSFLVYWLLRRRCARRVALQKGPFPAAWERILRSRVRFYQALPERKKERFRRMVRVFLVEVPVTGVRTEVDDAVRVLVAASAIMPIFGFKEWEYRRLREVLVYPKSFGEGYRTEGKPGENVAGQAGVESGAGYVILSKPDLLAGFDDPSRPYQVGVHEFAHVVEDEIAHHGLPAEVSPKVVQRWVRLMKRELAHPRAERAYLRAYAYKNPREFFAVLAEYFFKRPELVKERDPKVYRLLRGIFHQDPAALYGRPDGLPTLRTTAVAG